MITLLRSTSQASRLANRHTLLIPMAIFLLAMVLASVINPFRITAQGLSPQSAGGDLDSTFGADGKTTLSFADRNDLFALSLQPDGKIIAVGSDESDFAIARFDSNGILDPGFGVGGKVRTSFSDYDVGLAVAIQQDGRIVVAGFTNDRTASTADIALARYLINGNLDSSFGSGGKVVTRIDGRTTTARTLLIQPDGKIIVAGTAGATSDHGLIVRYNVNGSLDTSFGSSGAVEVDFFGTGDSFGAIALQPDGRIIAAGTATNPATNLNNFALARFQSDGGLDSSFGTNGKVTTSFFGYHDGIRAIAVRPDGRIIAGGFCTMSEDSDSARFALAQYNPDGSLDSGFGSAAQEADPVAVTQEGMVKPGLVVTDFFGHDARATTLAVQTDGRAVLAGTAQATDNYPSADFALARYEPDGKLDTSFGNTGKVLTDFYHSADSITAIAIQPDEKIIAAGKAVDDSDAFNPRWDFALARYLPGDHSDFNLDLSSRTVTADRGTTEVVRVLINRAGGFTGSVTVTPPEASAIKVKVKPRAEVPTVDASVKFKLKVKASALTGTHQLVFSATDEAGRKRSVTLTLVIR
jgi:uncharacterized delta-60 repeat protein